MENLFDTSTYNNIVERIKKLNNSTTPQWGKMNVAQAMAHLSESFMVPLSDKKLPRMLLGRILGPFIKHKLYNDDPWKKNMPTSPNFIIKDERNFSAERDKLLMLVDKFYKAGPMGITKYPHPFFGSYTPQQWGQMMYKHLDHHLTQFGV